MSIAAHVTALLVFDAITGFQLPKLAERVTSPSWVRKVPPSTWNFPSIGTQTLSMSAISPLYAKGWSLGISETHFVVSSAASRE